jgi:predicted kinase
MESKKSVLSIKESQVLDEYQATLKVPVRKSKNKIIVVMVGLVGSGKSSVARALAEIIGVALIEGDAIRVLLRQVNERFENASKIGEQAALTILKQGGNIVLDSDYVDEAKRKRVAAIAKDFGAKIIYIRTYADYDVMVGRTIERKYSADSFFGRAGSLWRGRQNVKGAVVKLREIWRRTPHHYVWRRDFPGGRWVLKKLPFKIFAEIDTTESSWILEVREVGKELLNL